LGEAKKKTCPSRGGRGESETGLGALRVGGVGRWARLQWKERRINAATPI